MSYFTEIVQECCSQCIVSCYGGNHKKGYYCGVGGRGAAEKLGFECLLNSI